MADVSLIEKIQVTKFKCAVEIVTQHLTVKL